MSFTDDYTAEELLKLWRYCVANPDLPEMIDTWDADMIVAALKETP